MLNETTPLIERFVQKPAARNTTTGLALATPSLRDVCSLSVYPRFSARPEIRFLLLYTLAGSLTGALGAVAFLLAGRHTKLSRLINARARHRR
jgi:hypothetical protein